MSKRKDIEASAPAAKIEPQVTVPAEAAPTEKPIELTAAEAPKAEPAIAEPVAPASKVEPPKAIEMPKPVEAVLKAVEAIKPEPAKPLPRLDAVKPEAVVPPPAATAAVSANEIAAQSRSNRFALLAASVAFAGCVGAMAGALTASVIARPGAAAQSPLAAVDLTSVKDAITSLRSDLAAMRTSVESSTRNANAQFAKATERFERIDRAQAAPAAQLKQALEAIDRLEKRPQTVQSVQSAPEVTGTVRPAAATPPAEPPRPHVIDGWVVRQVYRGVAVIQGRRVGTIEVEAGDIVPGVGRIESIRRQEGRWVVVTSKGLITQAAVHTLPPYMIPR